MVFEILVDAGETANKCTIMPLADRPDFRIFPVFGEGPLGPFSAPILLHHEGECLTRLVSSFPHPSALAGVDCVWRRLGKLVPRLQWVEDKIPVLARIPEGFETAYPRAGRPGADPSGGLATIEAIFTAAALLGRWDLTLLSRYYFARRFIEINSHRFLELGVEQVRDPKLWPTLPRPARDSRSRRRDRGRRRDREIER